MGELAALLPVSRPAVSQHLKVLKEVGLVVDRHEGTRRVYRVDPAGLAPVRAYLERFWKKAWSRSPSTPRAGRSADQQARQGEGPMTQQTISPVRASVSVGLDQKRCFEVFTDEMTSWWPASHHIGEAPIETIVVEPFVGGRWYTRHTDGAETETGVVTAYDPPNGFTVTWQIGADWAFHATW